MQARRRSVLRHGMSVSARKTNARDQGMHVQTVPLILHDQVIGTFNVESPEPRAFTESDLMFLEIFTRDVAVALNTWLPPSATR